MEEQAVLTHSRVVATTVVAIVAAGALAPFADPSAARGQTIIGRNFAASTYLLDSLSIPPDTMGAAGVDHYVELINGRFSIYRKFDGARVQTSTMNQFWTNAGAAPTGNSFDPRVVYDAHARRWYACAVDNRQGPNNFLFAVSSSSDPSGSWSGFKIDADTDDSNWADFPMLGYNGEGVFISANMPVLSAPQTRTGFLVLPKVGLLQPVPSIANRTLIEDVPLTQTGGSPQLAIDASNQVGTSMPVLSMFNTAAGILQRTDITPPGAPALVNAGQVNIAPASQPPDVDQPGPKRDLHAGDSRFSGNTLLHNGELLAVQTIADMGRSAIRYLRLDATTGAVLESSILTDPARAFTYPSVAINEFGDVVIGATGASTTEFASAYAFVGKLNAGITTFNTPTLLRAGVDAYEVLDSQNRNRWGDYSATTVDPADPSIFWTSQEYVAGNDLWGTNVSELIVPQPNEARWADPVPVGMFDDPTMWRTAHGGAPLTSDHLVFSRATDLASPAPATVILPPRPAGTYAYQTLSVRQGRWFVDLLNNTLDLSREVEIGPYGGSPQVVFANGTVTSRPLIIAHRSNSDGALALTNVRWTVQGEVTVGGTPSSAGGVGTLSIDNNSELDVVLALRVWPRGTVHFNSGSISAGPLDVRGGGRVLFGAAGPPRTLRGTWLDMAPGALIDMARGNMIIDYTGPSALPPVVANLVSGYAGGAWNGPGINSSVAAAGNTHALGFAEAGALGITTFAGQAVDNTTVVTRYTRYGDANLDGTVNLTDFNTLAANFGQLGRYWWQADFTFDGNVNLIDFNRLAANFGLSAGPDGVVGPDDWAALAAAVPEPTIAAVLFGVAALAAMSRRR
jgi:hypothetical protein